MKCLFLGWLSAWTKCHRKCGYKIRYGQYVTNAGWTDSSSIFLWTIWAVLGWTNSPSTFVFAWDAVLQWMLCTWVAKYSGLYMWVEVSLGQGVHGLFIIVPGIPTTTLRLPHSPPPPPAPPLPSLPRKTLNSGRNTCNSATKMYLWTGRLSMRNLSQNQRLKGLSRQFWLGAKISLVG
jgi:hypothetical protein